MINLAFGPVPSRRLGFSLGINHIPAKHCSYSCVYCQVGRTDHLEITRQSFYPIEEIVRAVEMKIAEVVKAGQKIDFLTFVPDGEPTLDVNLDKEIEALQGLGYPIAVISNATLIDHEEVQEALSKADWVSLKVDSVVEGIWHKINRPYRRLAIEKILQGICEFAEGYNGQLVTETMLVCGLNDSEEDITQLADFLEEIKPHQAYLSIPTRPPAEKWVSPPSSETLDKAFQIIAKRIPSIALLTGREENHFITTGKPVDDILSITAVHPIRESALQSMLERSAQSWEIIENLLAEKKILRIHYRGDNYYLRNFQLRD